MDCYLGCLIEILEILGNIWDWFVNILKTWAPILMAVFAYLSWQTAKQQKESQETLMRAQQISQEKLLNKQNDIQQRQLQLALLKEKQEICENFRQLIIGERDKVEELIYKCKKMTIDEFRKMISKNYITIARIKDLFGKKLQDDVNRLIKEFEKIFTWETNQIAELKLFERGVRHSDREKKLSKEDLEKYLAINKNNTAWFLNANKIFSNVLSEMNVDINKITKNLHDLC